MIEKGFYYHYKHDPAKGIFDAAYEVIGSAWSTESGGNVHSDQPDDFLADEVVIYRPLFPEALVYRNGKRFWIRPAKMWDQDIEVDGKKVRRFQRIEEPQLIAAFVQKRDVLYA